MIQLNLIFRQNYDNGKYSLIEEQLTKEQHTARSKSGLNNKCTQSLVARDGSLPRYCDSTVTGFVGFKKRMELSLEASNPHPKSPDKTNRDGGAKTSIGTYS